MCVPARLLCLLVLFCFSVRPGNCELVGHWQLNEGSGLTFADSAGMNDGFLPLLSKAPEWSTDTPATGFANPFSLKLDSSARNFVDTTFEGIGGDAARTISAWVKTSSTSSQSIVSYGARDGNGRKWHFRVNPDGGARVPGAIRTEAQGGNQTGDTSIADGMWHNVVSVYGAGGDNADVRHYLDGALQGATGTTDEPINTGIGGDFPRVSIGARRQSPPALDSFMNGWIDDVRMYDRELTAAEIMALGNSPTTTGMVAHWAFDDGPGNNTAAEAIAGNNGTLISDITDPTIAWSTDTPTPAQTASLAFNGTDSIVQTEYAGVGGANARTVAFWVKTEDLNTHGIVAWGDDAGNGEKWHLRVNNSAGNGPVGAIRTEVQGGFNIGTKNIADGEWHHVASVFPDGATNSGDILHYVDGELDVQGGLGARDINTDIDMEGKSLTIGRRTQGASQNYFNGLLSDVRVYDSALSASEIAALVPEPDGCSMILIMGTLGILGIRRRRR